MRTILLAAMMALAIHCTAQQTDGQADRRRNFDPKEMTQRRTDEAVKRYGLDEAQAKKLLELNQKYDTLLMRPMGGPGRGPRPGGDRGPRPESRPDSTQRREPTAEQKAKMEEGRKQWDAQRQKMEEARKAYDTELQAILTAEQYEKYKADSKERRGPRRR